MFGVSGSFELAGFLLARGIGLVYFLAFLVFYRQYPYLVGDKGLDPISERQGGLFEYFSLFYFFGSSKILKLSAAAGIFLSLTVLTGLTELLGGFAALTVFLVLWILLVSFINSGGLFTRPNWESILAETGLVAIFLPVFSVRTPELLIVLFRWILFRMMLGSALVKIKGGEEWKKLQALKNHFESQPFPGPLSRKFHCLPQRFLQGAALIIQTLMLILPFLYFAPQPAAALAGILTIAIQVAIFLSGNYAWLNVITAVLALSTFSDSILGFSPAMTSPYPHTGLLEFFALSVAVLSLNPILNFFSRDPNQNASYNPLHIANSYGAFPKTEEEHIELGIEGRIEDEWKEYKLYSSFRDQQKKPEQIAPYHHMLEYLSYFYVNGEVGKDEWLENLLEKTLKHDQKILNLYRKIPLQEPPAEVRAVKYRYKFTDEEERKQTGKYWKREKLGSFQSEK